MTSRNNNSAWDLSPVFDLIQSLSTRDPVPDTQAQPLVNDIGCGLASDHDSNRYNTKEKLGDFDRIWDFLGVQRDVPVLKVPTFEASTAVKGKTIDAYASDGALYYPPSSKSVKWRDEEEGLNLTDVQPDSPPDDGQLTKSQRKKRNRRARKAADSEAAATQEIKQIQIKLRKNSDTLTSAPFSQVIRAKSSPGVKDKRENEAEVAQCILEKHHCSTPGLDSPFMQATSPPSNTPKARTYTEIAKALTRKSNDLFRPAQVTPASHSTVGIPSQINPHSTNEAQSSAIHKTPVKKPLDSIHQSWQKQRPPADLYPDVQNSFSTPNKPRPQAKPSLSSSATMAVMTPTPMANRKRFEIVPLHFSNPLDRNWSLLLKLMQNFPADRAHLLSPLQLSINRPIANGIHVFVDASNIIIGFHDTLKRARGIPQYARVPRVNLNFHALALLLERRRPVTKRVLAGSTPEIPAFEEARQVGYETCILDKVWKAKELTERQRRFAARAGGDSSGYQSGSDSTGNALLGPSRPPSLSAGHQVAPQPPKWVEQAVDEILHLKILESIVDTPSVPNSATGIPLAANDAMLMSAANPTMVLATGDAAEAEYSPGFQRMVQRALQKGWTVEIMAWSKSISAEYRRMTQSPALEGRFKVIELDEYAEELFGEMV